MKSRSLDERFPSLTIYCLFFYWLVCLVTLGVTIGSVVQQVEVYRADCALAPSDYDYDSYYGYIPDNITYYGNIPINPGCIAGDIAVFALGLVVAFLGMIQSSTQLILMYRHHLSPRQLSLFNFVLMVLWIIVIAIGWDPTNWSYDYSTGTATPNITGWLYSYSSYWATESVGYGVGATLALAMGFAVMSIISFGLSTLLALYAFIIHHRNSRKKNSFVEEALMTAPKLSEKKVVSSAALRGNTGVSQDAGTPPLGSDHPDVTQLRPQEGVTTAQHLTEERNSVSASTPINIALLPDDDTRQHAPAITRDTQNTTKETISTIPSP